MLKMLIRNADVPDRPECVQTRAGLRERPSTHTDGWCVAAAAFIIALRLACGASAARADEQAPAPSPYQVNGQATFILQSLFKFTSPYHGTNSLNSRNESEYTDSYTLYIGGRATPNLEFYVDPEMIRGKGIGKALGLAGFTSGEVIRNPDLGQDPYLARYFLRWYIAAGQGEQKLEAAQNQVAGTHAAHRVVVTAGKLSVPDIFDLNSYAGNTRTQFMNWALLNNGAYDYAADTRGYTLGVTVEWIHPDWALRLGSFQMPAVANGIQLASNLQYNRGDQIELEVHPRLLATRPPAVVRLLAYNNLAHMGNYRESLALARQSGTTPDITATERNGVAKYGFGLNFEQPLGDGGATGIFGRFGWDDGATESFAYTEVDRHVALGAQLSGARWRRPRDRLAAAYVHDDLAAAHKDYLAAGGLGFLLGDGRLSYGPEQILEAYYAYQLNRYATLSLDYQGIANPGYNRDRGPVSVLSLRAHLEF